MKRCPFCAEEIQEAAIVCRYCRRDLPPGLATAAIRPSATRATAAARLSLDTIRELAHAFSNSYKSIQYFEKVTKICNEMDRQFVPGIFGQFERRKQVKPYDVAPEMEQVVSTSLLWGLVCFGTGIESSYADLQPEPVFTSRLVPIAEPFILHVLGFLPSLVERKVIQPEDAARLWGTVAHKVLQAAIQLEELGRQIGKSCERTSSQFLDSLNRVLPL